jgi:hypothetical protein
MSDNLPPRFHAALKAACEAIRPVDDNDFFTIILDARNAAREHMPDDHPSVVNTVACSAVYVEWICCGWDETMHPLSEGGVCLSELCASAIWDKQRELTEEEYKADYSPEEIDAVRAADKYSRDSWEVGALDLSEKGLIPSIDGGPHDD